MKYLPLISASFPGLTHFPILNLLYPRDAGGQFITCWFSMGSRNRACLTMVCRRISALAPGASSPSITHLGVLQGCFPLVFSILYFLAEITSLQKLFPLNDVILKVLPPSLMGLALGSGSSVRHGSFQLLGPHSSHSCSAVLPHNTST